MRAWLFAPAACCLLTCAPPAQPNKEEAAAYFGLQDGLTLGYDVQTNSGGSTTATMGFKSNNSFQDRLAFSREERNAGNIITETIVLAAEVDQLILLRSGDCLPNCTDYASPPNILSKPVNPNTNYETSTPTTQIVNGTRTAGPNERHQVTVGDEADVVTPAGTFRALLVNWRVFREGEQNSTDRQFYFAPGKGFVQLQQNAQTYKVRTGLSP